METYILGGGVTGLAAGITTQCPVLEALSNPGGICSSYYKGKNTLASPIRNNPNSYRFEIGGGHWIFGGSSHIIDFIKFLTPLKTYQRKSSVYFPDRNLYIPYPLQNHLRFFGDLDNSILQQMSTNFSSPPATTKEWLEKCFGNTLCERFFFPFHEMYTASLYKKIAPQDLYKSPVNIEQVQKGLETATSSVGYNVSFVYPEEGLGTLVQKMAQQCDIRYDNKVIAIDVKQKILFLANKQSLPYNNLISTLPLNKTLSLCSLTIEAPADPYTSVLVLNIGAVRESKCPEDHWLYIPKSKAKFHRVGIYSNVDESFLPQSKSQEVVSIYVEKAFLGGNKPSPAEISQYTKDVISELQDWGYIGEVEVADPTWIEVAYTWSWPNSSWKKNAIDLLKSHSVYPIGRYACWHFQGIADSIQDGFDVKKRFPELLMSR